MTFDEARIRAGSGRAVAERPRQLHRPDQGALSVPVELGFLPDRARPAPSRRAARLARDRDAARPSMAGRHGAAHRLPCGRRGLFPRPRRLAHQPADADLRHHPAARARLRDQRLFEEAKDTGWPKQGAGALQADAWHRWFYANRDPGQTGLVAIIHPWESGRDNSIDWDEALARVPTEGVEPYRRRDTSTSTGGAPAQGGVRPLPVAGAAFPRPRLGQAQAA